MCEMLEDRRMLSVYDLSIVGEEPYVGKVGLFGNGQAEQGIAFIPDQGWVTSSGSSSCAVGTCEDSAITFYDADWGETSQILYEPDDGGSNFFLNDHEYNVKHIGDVAYGNGHIYAPLQLDLVDDSGSYDGIVDIEYLARYTAAGALDASWGISFPTGIEIGGVGYYDGRLYAAEYVKSTTRDEWRRARVLEYGVADTSSYDTAYLNVPYINGIAFQDVNEFGIPIVHFAFGGSAADPKAPVGVSFWDFTEGTGAIAVVPLAELTAHTDQSDPLEVTRSDYYTYLSRPHAEGLTFDGDGDLWVSRGETVAELDLSLAPIADAGGDYSASEGSTITLDASGSYDPDGSIASYAWDLDNDGEYDDATGPSPSFPATNAGAYPVTLKATDDDGLWDTDVATVTVEAPGNHDPVLYNAWVTPQTGTTTDNFTFMVDYFDADGHEPSVADAVVDGAPHAMTRVSGSGGSATYNYTTTLSPGTHDYFFSFEDGHGGSYDTAVQTGPTVAGPGDASLQIYVNGYGGVPITDDIAVRYSVDGGDMRVVPGNALSYPGFTDQIPTPSTVRFEAWGFSDNHEFGEWEFFFDGPPVHESTADVVTWQIDSADEITARGYWQYTPQYYVVGGNVTSQYGGIEGATVTITGPSYNSQYVVGPSGVYSFADVPGGVPYTLSVELTDYVFAPSTISIPNLKESHSSFDFFGVYDGPTGEIRGTKWNDLDGDGMKDDGEPGLQGWTMFVDENNDGGWNGATEEPHYAVTGPDGTYVITDVPAGLHTVREVQQTGWEQTYPGNSTTTTSLTFPSGTNVPGTILDQNGNGTGFTDRLPGTGADYTANDANLDLSANSGFLTITSTRADLGTDPVADPDALEAYGLLLPNVGDQDVTIKALFRDIQVSGYHSSNQLTLYAGQSATQNIRAGIHYYHDHDYALWSRNPDDGVTHAWTTPSDASWSDGDDVELTLSRQDGRWQLDWHNLTNDDSGTSDSFSLPWVDGNALYVGIHYANARSSTSRTSLVESFTVELGSNYHQVNLASGETKQNINFGNRLLLDFGDAPDSYKTLFSSDGARHVPTGPMLGISRDSESDGQPNATATGDDNAGATPADEDGVVLNGLLVPGQYAPFTITASASGSVDAWLDINGNGTWDHPQEQFLTSVPVIAGPNNFTVLVPSDAAFGSTFSRFRISTAGGLPPTGMADDGEVEDYQLVIETVNRFVVNSTGETGDASPGDGNCDDGTGTCTLRAALEETNSLSNLAAGPDVIIFDIAGVGPHTIQPGSALPTVTEAVVIDGIREPDFAGTPVVELDGTNAGATSGLVLGAGAAGSTIRGLAINRFAWEGIDIIGGGNNTIEGNYLGTDVAGAVDQGNGYHGIWVSDSTSNQIGGTGVGVGNVISGNRYGMVIAGPGSTGNMVEGNRIGTDAAGTAAVPNDFHGVLIQNDATGNTIGGTTSGSGNQISGNTRNGVKIIGAATTGNMVQGNLIGTDATGSAPLANVRHGIEITGGASSNTVGGTAAGAGNVISGNTRYGMLIGTAGTTGNVVEGNLIGTDAAGAVPLGNSLHGIVMNGGATGNTIGGTAAGAGNVISGNDRFGVVISNPPTTGNVFAGNLIGTNATGSAALRNDFHGVLITGGAHSNTIGGTAAGAGNVISGNSLSGVKVVGAGTSGNLVQGNRIGTDGAGNVSLANGRDGVEISSSATGNTIGGTAAGAGNVISGNTRYGVITNTPTATGNVLEGNRIGTNAAGTSALGNGEHGVVMALGAHANTIGGTAAGAGNVISGNSNHGVFLSGDNNILQGNLIGTDAAGTGPLGNAGSGIFVAAADGTQIGGTMSGAGNTIAYNGVRGVAVFSGNTRNRISRNSIHDNGGAARLGIDLNNDNATANDAGDPDTGANNLQNFPEMVSATINGANVDIQYSVPSTSANSSFPLTVEFFLADADGQEGQTYLGSDSYSEGTTPTATVPNGGAVAGTKIVATATDDGNTSEFSTSVTVALPLLAAGGEASQESRAEAQELRADELLTMVDVAIDLLAGAGFAAESFSSIQVAIADLPGATLGLATGDTITIDVDAAGYGWYVRPELRDPRQEPADSDAASDSGLSTLASRPRMDLLTVVLHELRHVLGHEDIDDILSDDVMNGWLPVGVRRM